MGEVFYVLFMEISVSVILLSILGWMQFAMGDEVRWGVGEYNSYDIHEDTNVDLKIEFFAWLQ